MLGAPSFPIKYKEKEDFKFTCGAFQHINEDSEKIKFEKDKVGFPDILLSKECNLFVENLNEYQLSRIKTNLCELIKMLDYTDFFFDLITDHNNNYRCCYVHCNKPAKYHQKSIQIHKIGSYCEDCKIEFEANCIENSQINPQKGTIIGEN